MIKSAYRKGSKLKFLISPPQNEFLSGKQQLAKWETRLRHARYLSGRLICNTTRPSAAAPRRRSNFAVHTTFRRLWSGRHAGGVPVPVGTPGIGCASHLQHQAARPMGPYQTVVRLVHGERRGRPVLRKWSVSRKWRSCFWSGMSEAEAAAGKAAKASKTAKAARHGRRRAVGWSSRTGCRRRRRSRRRCRSLRHGCCGCRHRCAGGPRGKMWVPAWQWGASSTLRPFRRFWRLRRGRWVLLRVSVSQLAWPVPAAAGSGCCWCYSQCMDRFTRYSNLLFS
ncbi:unnamed protein product, partial [Phaeothamnion confervicola]